MNNDAYWAALFAALDAMTDEEFAKFVEECDGKRSLFAIEEDEEWSWINYVQHWNTSEQWSMSSRT